ncbi:MAG: M1 family metallopeptidase [Candidatus Kryptonium sp.]|nr:M1 family metallopeptidase [Candidatus Kryptonium sp.]
MGIIFRFLFIFLLLPSFLFSQRVGYFQQRVDYVMDVFLDTKTHKLIGKQVAVYHNNSPDTLYEIFYHLYLNAFKPGSSMQVRGDVIRNGLGERIRTLKPEEYGWTNVKSLKANDEEIEFEIFDTVLKAKLKKPLVPGSSVKLEMEFESQIPKQTRRNGRDNREGVDYSMAQWYPKICEYDFEGWHVNQYIEREFYGVWGSFDVKITLPADYLVGATGVIQNPNEVMCGYELGAVDTVIFPSQWKKNSGSKFKTWHFKAEKVHDFAWVADRDYIHEITWLQLENDTIIIHLLYQPDVYMLWRETGKFTKEIIKLYSEWFYKYPYKTFTVAQAGDGGMEYPTLIMITGRRGRTSMIGILAHEIGHIWFYGLIGNNETKEAWIDEGGASFVTPRIFKNFLGEKWSDFVGIDKMLRPNLDIYGGYRNYIRFSNLGYEEPVLLHSDFFREPITYTNAVYGKGASVFEMLEYVVGDSVFDKIMKEFFKEWVFKHPTTKDFERTAEKVSGMKLDWFFDQWLKTTRKCDYSIENFSGKWTTENGLKKYKIKVKLRNRGQIVMPVDLYIYFEDGTYQKVIIPLDIQLKAKQEPDAIVLPPWFWVNPSYELEISFDKKVKMVEIDSRLRLRDINRLNNRTGILNKIQFKFFEQTHLNPPLEKYWFSVRPSIWFAQRDGIRPGFFANGAYLFDYYETKLGLWFNTKTKNFDYMLSYTNNTLPVLGRLSGFGIEFLKIHGVKKFYFEIFKSIRPLYLTIPPFYNLSIFFEHASLVEEKLPFFNLKWESGNFNSVGFKLSANTQISRTFLLGNLFFKTTTANSAKNFTNISVELKQRTILQTLEHSLRFFFVNSYGQPPEQEKFYFTASPYEQFFNQSFRMIYLIDEKFSRRTNLFLKGGLNLRGYFDIFDIWITRGSAVNFDLVFLKSQTFHLSIFYDIAIFKWAKETSLISQIPRFEEIEKIGSLAYDYGFEINLRPLIFIPSVAENLINSFNRLNISVVFPVGRTGEAPKFRWALEIKVER